MIVGIPCTHNHVEYVEYIPLEGVEFYFYFHYLSHFAYVFLCSIDTGAVHANRHMCKH